MISTLQDLIDQQAQKVGCGLAPYATKADQSRGRFVPEAPSSTRSPFQRDRDRIVHSGAFRKLRNKTQVFIENEGDYYRTRLTHSLEVAQISRSAARLLGLDEDLTEAIALAHDLGHTCFGHSGEHVLDTEMAPYGGFDHNDQTFRIITKLEHNYAAFDGLNLTWEMLEGVAKHNGPLLPLKDGEKLPVTLREFNEKWDLELDSYASLEAQISAIADDIAYNTHDVDDGCRAGYIDFATLKKLPLFGPTTEKMQLRFSQADEQRIIRETVRDVVGQLVADLLDNTRKNLADLNPRSVEDIRRAKKMTACLSDPMKAHVREVSAFLYDHMYRAEEVNRIREKADAVVRDLFRLFMEKPEYLPADWAKRVQQQATDLAWRARLVTDYIAGMTDPYAVKEHRRLFLTETLI